MKKIVTILVLGFITTSAFGQDGIDIYVTGNATEISGDTLVYNQTNGDAFDVSLDIKNHTGQSHDWRITRSRLNVPAGYVDFLCWGHATDPFGGTCYGASNMQGNLWTSPANDAFTIADGEYGKFKANINLDETINGQGHYRYYVSDDGINYTDSIDVVVKFNAASIKSMKEEISVSIVPNPATDYIHISMTGIESASVKMVDAFGSTVFKETIGASKKLNVSDFNSGIYFLMFDVPGKKPFTRKVIIRN
jgi:hypothetical protein